jgi:hypothetical protein
LGGADKDDYTRKVIGHSGKNRGKGSYEHPLSIELLSEQVIERLAFGLDFSHLLDSRKNP